MDGASNGQEARTYFELGRVENRDAGPRYTIDGYG